MTHAGDKRKGEFTITQPPATKKQKPNPPKDEYEDEFEKYMREIEQTANKQKTKAIQKQKKIINNPQNQPNSRLDLDNNTPMDAFIEQMQSSNPRFLPSR